MHSYAVRLFCRSDVGAATVLLLSDNMLKYICYINLSIIITYLAQKLGVWHIVELAQICRYHFTAGPLIETNERVCNFCEAFQFKLLHFLVVTREIPDHSYRTLSNFNPNLSFSPSHSPSPLYRAFVCLVGFSFGMRSDQFDGNRIQRRIDLRRCRFKYSLDK